ncbi:MAG: ThiF family adenylyltransferase, partial [Candidatus Competibacter sp.]
MTNEELLRYSRQILLPEFDIEGQERLRCSRVLIVGLGGLGSAVAMYLAAAGVGQLTLVDFDKVDLSNLQRQIVHRTADIGRPKVESARDTLLALNPLVEIITVPKMLDDAELL